ncbi:MAG: hypothetical protein L0L39_02190 [Atopostipes suicloacalis]|nr:hypothetical protein [Atopostipes suicloacalis]MDN6730972.1 hypothetical protein [Atopostipes suicloacalis]
MNVLFIVLNEADHLEDLLEKFIEIGIKGATILDSQGMGFAMNHSGHGNEPFFGKIRSMIDNSRPYNKTVFTVIDDEETLEKAISVTKEVFGDVYEPGLGMMFTMPVNNVYGMKNINNLKDTE